MQKLPELPPLQHKGVFRPGWISSVICGKSGCGKTSLLMWLIPQVSEKIKIIVIATKVRNVNAHLSIADWARKHNICCYIMEEAQGIEHFIDSLQTQKLLVKGASEMLLIFDDFAIYNHSRSIDERLVLSAFTKWRNLGVNVIIVCQDISMVDPKCRNCTNLRVLFNTSSKPKIDIFLRDLRGWVPDQRVLDNCVKYLKVVPYSFLMVRDYPGEIAIGTGVEGNSNIRTVLTMKDVIVPTYREIMKEMGASTQEELHDAAAQAQREMGNTASQVNEDVDEEDSDDSSISSGSEY